MRLCFWNENRAWVCTQLCFWNENRAWVCIQLCFWNENRACVWIHHSFWKLEQGIRLIVSRSAFGNENVACCFIPLCFWNTIENKENFQIEFITEKLVHEEMNLNNKSILLKEIIIIIKKDWQCKAGRGRLTPYQSGDPSPILPAYRGKEDKGKIVED